MTQLLVRQIWAAVATSSSHLVELSNNEIVQMLSNQMMSDLALNAEEFEVMEQYLNTRVPLIRDLIGTDAFGEL